MAAGLLAVLGLGLYLAARHVLASDLVRAQIEQQLSARFGQPVHIASADASIFPRIAVDLQNVTVGEPAAVHLAHVRVATGLRALFSRTIADAEVELRDGRIALPLPFALAPAAAPSAGSSASASSLTIASIRLISLRNIALVAGAQSLRLDLESSLAGDRLDISSLTARAEKTRITGRGALTSLSRVEGRLDADADPLDLDEMIAIGSALTSDASPSRRRQARAAPQGTLHLVIATKAPKGQFAGYAFRDLSTTADVTAGQFSLSPLAVRIFGGGFKGALAADTAGAVPRLRLNGRVDGLDMSEIMKVSGAPGGVTGRLGGTIALTAEGSSALEIMRTARGRLGVSITDGELPHLDMIRTVVLAFGKPSGAPPQGSGTAFSRLGGTFALASGVLTSDDLALASRDLDMRGRGSVRLASGAIAARADVSLSRELTAQAGTDLRRYAQEDGRVVVPAVISGSLSNPSVSVDVVAAGRRALQNELQRRAKDFLGGLFKKKKGGG